MTLQLERPPAGTAPGLTPEQSEYFSDHRMAVLATSRRDGSPQLSTVYYHFDGCDVVISTTRERAKWANIRRHPGVALLVPEGRRQLVVYGRAEPVDLDPERTELHRRLRRAIGVDRARDDQALANELEDAGRVIIRVRPHHALMNN